MNPNHEKAQELAAKASLLRTRGKFAEAAVLYAEAASLQRAALKRVPSAQPRTKGILSVSLAAMLYKAEDYETAELDLYAMLADTSLPAFARKELKELLDVVQLRQVVDAQRSK